MISGPTRSASAQSPQRSFDDLVDEASAAPVEGWDFTFLRGRTVAPPIPWSYRDIARRLVAQARLVLERGIHDQITRTGGFEVRSRRFLVQARTLV